MQSQNLQNADSAVLAFCSGLDQLAAWTLRLPATLLGAQGLQGIGEVATPAFEGNALLRSAVHIQYIPQFYREHCCL